MILQGENYLTRERKSHPEDIKEKTSENDLCIGGENMQTYRQNFTAKLKSTRQQRVVNANKPRKNSIQRKKVQIKIKDN